MRLWGANGAKIALNTRAAPVPASATLPPTYAHIDCMPFGDRTRQGHGRHLTCWLTREPFVQLLHMRTRPRQPRSSYIKSTSSPAAVASHRRGLRAEPVRRWMLLMQPNALHETQLARLGRTPRALSVYDVREVYDAQKTLCTGTCVRLRRASRRLQVTSATRPDGVTVAQRSQTNMRGRFAFAEHPMTSRTRLAVKASIRE